MIGGGILWKMSVGDFLAGNPHNDRYDNDEVWYFYQVAQDRGESFGHSAAVKLPGLDPSRVRKQEAEDRRESS